MAFSLLTSVIDIVNAQIDANSCFELRGQYPITLFATGVSGARKQNNLVTFYLLNRKGYVMGFPNDTIQEAGTTILTNYTVPADLIGVADFGLAVKEYKANYNFNPVSELLKMSSALALKIPFVLTELKYSTSAITSFNSSPSDIPDAPSVANIGWGMSALMNPVFAKSKYWQRFKINRDDGVNARTFFVSDLLAYRQSCRVKIDVTGHNSSDYISQEGYLTIDLSEPHDPVVGISFD